MIPKQYAFVVRKVGESDMPTVKEAMDSSEKSGWKKTISIGLKSLNKIQSSDIVKQPKAVEVLPNKCFLKCKLNARGKLLRWKARLLVCGSLDRDSPKTFWLLLLNIKS